MGVSGNNCLPPHALVYHHDHYEDAGFIHIWGCIPHFQTQPCGVQVVAVPESASDGAGLSPDGDTSMAMSKDGGCPQIIVSQGLTLCLFNIVTMATGHIYRLYRFSMDVFGDVPINVDFPAHYCQ